MQFTSEQIQAYKAKHGEVFEYEFTSGKSCLLRRPKRQDLSYISAIKDPIKMNEALLKAVWLDGDKEIQEDDILFMSLSAKLEELLKLEEVAVKKH